MFTLVVPICKFDLRRRTLNPELRKGRVSSGCLRMHRGWKSYTSHVKGKNAFGPSLFNTLNSLYRYSRVVSSKSRQFTGSARWVGMRHLNNTCIHTPYQFYQNITPYPRSSRQISWSFKAQPRPTEFNELPDNEEDVARVAILNKVMKGRQPTDLMLRCKWSSSSPFSVR